MKKDYVDNVDWSKVNFYDQNHLKTFDLRIGCDAQTLANTLLNNTDLDSDEDMEADGPMNDYSLFIKHCLKYYQRLAFEIYNRLETVWRPYKSIECLIPEKALSKAFHDANPAIINEVTTKFARCMMVGDQMIAEQDVQEEWNLLLQYTETFKTDIPIDQFWDIILNYKEEDQYLFRNLGRFALAACGIPHSNSEPERSFSFERITKTKLRNKLGLETLNATMCVHNMLKIFGVLENILDLEPTPEMIALVRNHAYNNYMTGQNNSSENM